MIHSFEPRASLSRMLHRWIARLIFVASIPYEIPSLMKLARRGAPDTSRAHTIPSKVEPGHLVFGKTNSIRGKWLQGFLKTTAYTHVGIMKQRDKQWYILHVSPGSLRHFFRDGGVREDPWETFVTASKISDYSFYRMREGSNEKLLEAADAIARRRPPFDIHYDLQDPKRLYCSEFVWHLGLHLGQDWVESRFQDMRLLGIHALAIIPDAITQSQHLEQVTAPS